MPNKMQEVNKHSCSHGEICKRDIPQLMEISDIVRESKVNISFFFKANMQVKPGQFIMVWLPGVDEKPMAVSYMKKNEFGFTHHSIGAFTKALDNLKKGNELGIRGPYGNSFSQKDNACVVGGGIGMASVATLIDSLKNPVIINGARSKDHLVYVERFKKKNMIAVTNDGSFGKKVFTTDVLECVLNENKKIKIVHTCGPERMMKKIFDICEKNGVECEASLERYMACGFGVCGKCMINDKICCMDGPVFKSKDLRMLLDFGNFARLKSGRKVTLEDYHSAH